MSAPRQGSTTLLGAEGARELIAFLTAPAPSRSAVIERAVQEGGPVHRLRLRHPEAAAADGGQEPEATEPEAKEPAAPARPTEPHLLDRHVLRLAPAPRPARAEEPPPLFPPGTAVLTNLNSAQLPGGSTVLQDDETIEADVLRARPRHVRVLVDLSSQDKNTGPSERLLRLHDSLFRTAKACTELPERPESFVVLVLGGIDAARVPHPCSGLFTGFAKSLALEWPDSSVVSVVHEAADIASAEADTAAEAVAEQLLPVVSFAGGTRLLWQAAPNPGRSRPQQPGPDREPAPYTVVAAGGGRGIGAELLAALARRDRPRLHVIGSTRLDTVREADVLLTRKDFIRTRTTAAGADRLTVREANAAFDRLSAAREVKANLTALEEICGAGRVTYHACDLRDRAAVDAVVGRINDAEGGGHVDLLLNIAGTNRAASVDQKSLGDFRTVRDLKVRTYANLKAAFGGGQPRRWCNFGSFVGFTGQTGETDYGAANDYFNTAALYGSSRGAREFTIGWTLWRDVGLGATPIMRTFLAKSAQFTAMPTAEGIDHFLHELDQAEHTPVTVLFGDPERAAIEAAVPGYLDFCRTPPKPPAPTAPAPARALPDFFVDDITGRGPDRLTVVRTFNQDRDAYLHEHVVNGFPTLPGTFVPELAAQAAMHLVPGRVPVVFEDIRLDSFLRVYRPGRDETKRIKAHLVSHGPHESVVDIEVTGDVLAPGGRLLVKDRRHFSARVRLRDEHVAPPRWDHWDDQGAERMADPYHVPNPAVLLSGVFVSTADTRTHPNGRRARYVPDRPGIERWFSSLVVPSVLLDGLARVSVLDRSEGDWTPLAVPRTIRRIDLYGGHTDASLASAGTGVELYSLPSRLDLESEEDNRALAVTAAGDVVLQIKDMTGVVLGHVNQSTGEYRERRRPAEEATA
ncbi:polyketide synthase-like dehydratase family protein [Streptomyces sp. SLBN-118]|uniref:KR domain-containing protein n=1 Tax=Streptomyces sp. SLBN-118 TaxID=2768454 RepID=UPI0011515414|nr:KR domain-containing protein [Streptomyces sp. SLBN-118]TQK44235.1 polyketide synthase-like dehydratase family protein [Streptomyces sp. SLBN-118]